MKLLSASLLLPAFTKEGMPDCGGADQAFACELRRFTRLEDPEVEVCPPIADPDS